MALATIAKLFQNGRSQAVRVPKEFRFPETASAQSRRESCSNRSSQHRRMV
jgi:hypothetical protein